MWLSKVQRTSSSTGSLRPSQAARPVAVASWWAVSAMCSSTASLPPAVAIKRQDVPGNERLICSARTEALGHKVQIERIFFTEPANVFAGGHLLQDRRRDAHSGHVF